MAAIGYARARWRLVGALALPWLAGNAWLAGMLLLPAHPLAFAAWTALFAVVPAVVVVGVVLDCRYGWSPLDTFYGLVAPIVLAPIAYGLNLLLLAAGL